MKGNHKHEIIIYWSKDDKAFIAKVPELPGCFADGQSYQVTLSNVESIIEDRIETAELLGHTLPEPKGKLMYA